ncbi:hypothetical protein JCM10212_004360 [Sporobolomyces blumeae]
MPSRRPCRNLVRDGDCPDEALCPDRHDLPHCDVCARYLDTIGNYRQHVASAAHRAEIVRRANRFEIVDDGRKLECILCKLRMSQHDAPHHLEGARHQLSIRSRLARDAQTVAELGTSDVEVLPEGDVDFGLIEFDDANDNQRSTKLEVRARYRPISIAGATLSDDKTRKKKQFSVQDFPEPVKVRPGKSAYVAVHFLPRKTIGFYEDTLTIRLEVGASKGAPEQATITRTIRGGVGHQKDRDEFGAKTPYVRQDPRRKPRAEEKKTVSAPKDDFRQNIPWTGKLPWYRPSPWLIKILEDGPIGLQIKTARRAIGLMTYQNYSRFWTALLYCESYQDELDVRAYDLENVKMNKKPSGLYVHNVPGLAEKRPAVLRGDQIKVQMRNSSDKRWFAGIVKSVEESRIGIEFDKSFAPEASANFDVQFTVSRIPSRRQIHALAQPLPRSQLLFPTLNAEYTGRPSQAMIDQHPEFISPLVESNPAQAEAVYSIFHRSHGPAPYVVFGPPGTGKTVTIIEACLQLHKYQGAKILLTAPSNSAADLLCTRLGLSKKRVLRLNAPSRTPADVPAEVSKYSFKLDGIFACPDVEDLVKYDVVVSTCISASILGGIGLKKGHFSHIFIDEAGQATEPEAFLPLSLAADSTSAILAGDPKQLGPIIRSPVSVAMGLGTSLLERLMMTAEYDDKDVSRRGLTYTKLVLNYRSHPKLLKVPNHEFYANELQACASRNVTDVLKRWEGWPNKAFPIIFHSVAGQDEREGQSPSFFNVSEISIVRDYVERLKGSRKVSVVDSDIGVIAPYAAQCKRLRIALKQQQHPKLTIGSVEQFQGSERSIILISTVRSNSEFLANDKRFALGFLSHEKRFNVAITRPQAGLIVCGDPNVLALDPLWRRFLVHVHDNGGWAGDEWDPEPYRDPNYDPVEEARLRKERFIDAVANQFSFASLGDSDWADGHEI